MKFIIKNILKKNQSTQKDREYFFQKNEEQLQREKVVLDYEFIRSFAR